MEKDSQQTDQPTSQNPQTRSEGQPENQPNMASLLAEEGENIQFPHHGEIRQGMIASIEPGQIFVSVGTKTEGIIAGKEYEQIPPEELEQLQVGQEIPVYVIKSEDQNGNVVLSYTRAREALGWDLAEQLAKSKEPYEVTVVAVNKGGLIASLEGLRGFIPISQIGHRRLAATAGADQEERLAKTIGETLQVIVLEADPDRHRLVLSEKEALGETPESIKESVMEELHEGDVLTGRVTGLSDFGAFVNVHGADGLVHVSEISWEPIKRPSDVLKVGQEVQVKVISLDRERKRIGLSIRQLLPDPWTQKVAGLREGQLVQGTITHLVKYGAFARIDDTDLEGLIHISEISDRRIEHPKEVLSEGEEVTLRIIRIEPESHRIGLSLRRVESMAYADMDWEILEEELETIEEGSPEGETSTPAPEATAEENAPSAEQEPEETSKPAEPQEEAKSGEEKGPDSQEPPVAQDKAPDPTEPEDPELRADPAPVGPTFPRSEQDGDSFPA